MHSTDNLDDGYLGSGKILGYSIGKHGRENHVKEIVEFVDTREALKLREARLVNEELLDDPLNINLKYGGEGGWEHVNQRSDVQRSKGLRGNAQMEVLRQTDEVWRRTKSLKISAKLVEAYSSGVKVPTMPNWVGRKHSDESKAKMSESSIGKHRGSKNSQFGSCWMRKDDVSTKVKNKKLMPI